MPVRWLLIGRLAQVVSVTLALLFATGLAAESLLRICGLWPLDPAQVHSDIVPDSYSGWRMRPDVHAAREQEITNNFGFHDQREYANKPAPNLERVIVQGSSVVYGLKCGLSETLPRQLERALLKAKSNPVEVLNFGVQGYSLLNAVGQTSAYALAFQPTAAVIVLDIQMCYPEEPIPVPRPEPDARGVKRLDPTEAWLRRSAKHSVLLSIVAAPGQLQLRLKRLLPLALKQEKAGKIPSAPVNELGTPNDSAKTPPGIKKSRTGTVGNPAAAMARSRRLRSVLGALLAAYSESGVAVLVVTPFGPYYQVTDEVLARFTLHHVTPFIPEYGGFRQAVHGELARIRVDVETVVQEYGAVLVDMTPENLKLTADAPPYFLKDGVHPSPSGYSYLASRIVPVLVEAMNRERQKGN